MFELTYRRGSVQSKTWVVIHLCSPPEVVAQEATSGPLIPRLDLAPDGVCLAKGVTSPAGALLPHRFTLTN